MINRETVEAFQDRRRNAYNWTLNYRNNHSKTHNTSLAIRLISEATRATTIRRMIVPRTPPQQPQRRVPVRLPNATIPRRTVIIIVPRIRAPFPNISVEIVQSESIRFKTTNICSLKAINSLRRVSVIRISVVIG